jgi:hypothetical protein
MTEGFEWVLEGKLLRLSCSGAVEDMTRERGKTVEGIGEGPKPRCNHKAIAKTGGRLHGRDVGI